MSHKKLPRRDVDRSKQDPSDQIREWYKHYTDAGGLLLPISRDGYNEAPPAAWNKPGYRGLDIENAHARIINCRNVGIGMSGSLFLLDADSATGERYVDEAVGDNPTLSVWTPRGKQYVFKGDNIEQLQVPVMGLDTRVAGKGYGMGPGSYRTGKSYMEKWKNKTWHEMNEEQAGLPAHDSPWFYQVDAIVPVRDADDPIYALLNKMKTVKHQEKQKKITVRSYDRRKWHLSDLEKMLEHISADGSRDEWLPVLFGAKEHFGDKARGLVEEWSKTSSKFDQEDFDRSWDNAYPGKVTIGTVVYLAEAAGYVKPGIGRRNYIMKSATAIEGLRTDHNGNPLPLVYLLEGQRDYWSLDGAQVLRDYCAEFPQHALYIAGGTTNDFKHIGLAPKPKEDPEKREKVEYDEGTLLFESANVMGLCLRLGPMANWGWSYKREDTTYWKHVDPKEQQLKFIVERARQEGFLPVIEGLSDGPMLRKDGTILSTPGYDSQTGIYAGFDKKGWPKIPEKPTKKNAEHAAEILLSIVQDTPFETNADRGVFLSLVLSVVARDYAGGNIPVHLITANNMGAGKGTLCQIASVIATGNLPTILPTNDVGFDLRNRADAATEERKRLMMLAMRGARLAVIDNIPAGIPFGNSSIEEAVTVGTDTEIGVLKDRRLGRNDMKGEASAKFRTVLAATGNNMTICSDMPRRALYCSLKTPHEDPATQADYKYSDPVETAKNYRKVLYSMCLVMLLAYHQSKDKIKNKKVGSFGGWHERIRNTIIWSLGKDYDPWITNEKLRAQANPEKVDTLEFLAAWYELYKDQEITLAKQLMDTLSDEWKSEPNERILSALEALPLAPPKKNVPVNVKSLAAWINARTNMPGPYTIHQGTKRHSYYVRSRDDMADPTAFETEK